MMINLFNATDHSGGHPPTTPGNAPADRALRNRFLKAVKEGRVDEVRNLISNHGINPNFGTDDAAGTFPLILAAKNGDLPMIATLIYYGADVNCASNNGKSPLIYALEYKKPRAASVLIGRGANVNHADSLGRTALHVTTTENMYPMTRVLLSKGADPNAVTLDGYTPLMQSVLRKDRALLPFDTSIVQALLEANGSGGPSDPTLATERDRLTAVHIAAARGFVEDLKAIVRSEEGTRACSCLDVLNRSPLWLAADRGHADAVRVLINSSLDVVNRPSIDPQNPTPLYAMAMNSNGGVAVEGMTILLNSSADLRVRTADGRTVLHRACQLGNLEMVKLLLRKGADPLAADNEGKQPLVCLPWWNIVFLGLRGV